MMMTVSSLPVLVTTLPESAYLSAGMMKLVFEKSEPVIVRPVAVLASPENSRAIEDCMLEVKVGPVRVL